MRRLIPGFAILLTFQVSTACLNDRDSLAAEVSRKPDWIWVIVGRFERNPPEYYQARIKRVEAELGDHPQSLGLYDDIAVAYDRIHQDDKALVWIEKKRAILERIDPKRSMKMDWYRYYANAGTFHVHHWFGHQSKDVGEVEKAEAYIAKSILLNPGAHEGREGFQLAAIRWILANVDLPVNERESFADSPELNEATGLARMKSIDGLIGLIRLGGAWESPDIYDALAKRLNEVYRQRLLGQIAVLRRDELLKAGTKPFGSMSDMKYDPAGSYANENLREFKTLRADAEAWQKERADFMVSRIRAGKHPDTDAGFWAGYIERPKPDIWTPPFWETRNRAGDAVVAFFVLGSGIAIAIYVVTNRRKKTVGSAETKPV